MFIRIKPSLKKTLAACWGGGQSNWEVGAQPGIGTVPALYTGVNYQSIIGWCNNNNLNVNNYTVEFLDWQVNHAWRAGTADSMTPMVSFTKDLTTLTGQQLFSVSYGLGGSVMVDDGTTPLAGYWSPNAVNIEPSTADTTSGRNHYQIIKNLLIKSVLEMSSRGFNLDFKFDLFDHGEADMLSVFRSANWRTEYEAMRNQLAIDVENATGNTSLYSSKPIFFHTGGPNYSNVNNRIGYATVRQHQVDAVAALGGALIIKDDLFPVADGVHDDRAVQIIKGQRAAVAAFALY